MAQNPYEPPRTAPVSGRSKAFGVFMLIISIPAGMICGCVTCGGATYVTQGEPNTHHIVPALLGLTVAVGTWLYLRSFGTRS